MNAYFQELDYRDTPIGGLSLRRRREHRLGTDVYEIKLGDEFLMSSLFTASEIALADLGLKPFADRAIDVAVAGLGLGYTAKAVLDHGNVASLVVVEMLEPVIGWHRKGLLPLGTALADDPRCRFIPGDFFALAASRDGLDPMEPQRQFDALLVDIDHSPDALLDERSTGFYTTEGLTAVARHVRPGGIFGLWSDALPDPAFVDRLAGVFAGASAEPVTFHNPLLDEPYTQTVYLARTGVDGAPT
ncbi:spermidine synthase [Phreatobacter sp. HK31-P]